MEILVIVIIAALVVTDIGEKISILRLFLIPGRVTTRLSAFAAATLQFPPEVVTDWFANFTNAYLKW